jgi:hypothetical protein
LFILISVSLVIGNCIIIPSGGLKSFSSEQEKPIGTTHLYHRKAGG